MRLELFKDAASEIEADRAWYRGGAERDRLRPLDCCPDADRVQLLLEEDRSDVGRDGNARRRADRQVLLRSHNSRRRFASGAALHASGGAAASVSRAFA